MQIRIVTRRPFFRLCTLLGPLSALAATGPNPQSVVFTFRAEPASARLQESIVVRSAPDGSRSIAIDIVNASAGDLFLHDLTLRFPWVGPAFGRDGMLASGGGCMFRTPTTVHPDPQSARASETFLLARHSSGHAFAGFLTWKTFRSHLSYADGHLVVTAEGEGRRLRPGEKLSLEKLWLQDNASWQNLLYAYADEIARENRIVLRPRPAYVGWSSWDYYGGRFTYGQVMSNLDALMTLDVGANLLQIDGGWWTRCGDYLSPRSNLPGGIAHLAAEFRRRGLTAGIHLDGMRADIDSQVVIRHPEFFLKDQHGELIGGQPAKNGGKRGRVYFDFSHPGARAHLAGAIRTLRRDWGCDYFKIDFLKFGVPAYLLQEAGRDKDGTRIVPHNDALTSLERFHLGMAALRQAMGDDAYFLACSAEFGPVYGHVDALRTGGDIDPTFSRFSRSVMENGGNFYLHRKVVLVDADYHVARSRHDEDADLTRDPRKTGGNMPLNEAGLWTHYVGLFGGPKISGDNLTILREERKALFRMAVDLPACERFVPLDFWQHGRDRDDPFGVFLGEASGRVYLAVFNWRTEPRTFRLGGLLPAETQGVAQIAGDASLTRNATTLQVGLSARSSSIFAFDSAATDFDRLRHAMTVESLPSPPEASPSR